MCGPPSADAFLVTLCLILFLACAVNFACPAGSAAAVSLCATMLAYTGHYLLPLARAPLLSHILEAAHVSFDMQYNNR